MVIKIDLNLERVASEDKKLLSVHCSSPIWNACTQFVGDRTVIWFVFGNAIGNGNGGVGRSFFDASVMGKYHPMTDATCAVDGGRFGGFKFTCDAFSSVFE